MRLSLIIPAYNAADTMERSVTTIIRKLELPKNEYEIIIAEDGSTDGSERVAFELSKKFKNVRCLSSRTRKGKGGALKDAFRAARGMFVAFMDVDLSSDISCIPNLMRKLEEGADIVVGSRNTKGSVVRRSLTRGIMSASYNFLAQIIFGTGIKDLQCGCKAFNRAALPFALSAKSDGFFWDTEFLISAEKNGLRIEEVPISWTEFKKTKVRPVDSFKMFASLVKLRLGISAAYL